MIEVNSDCQSSDGGCWAESSLVRLGQLIVVQLLVIVAGNLCTPHKLRQNSNTKSKAQELGAQEKLGSKAKATCELATTVHVYIYI